MSQKSPENCVEVYQRGLASGMTSFQNLTVFSVLFNLVTMETVFVFLFLPTDSPHSYIHIPFMQIPCLR